MAIDWDHRCRGGKESGEKFFCLTSFVWYYTKSEHDGGCSYPDNVYSLGKDANNGYPLEADANSTYPPEKDAIGGGAVLLWDEEYRLTWENDDPEYPVIVRWTTGASELAGGDGEFNTWERSQ